MSRLLRRALASSEAAIGRGSYGTPPSIASSLAVRIRLLSLLGAETELVERLELLLALTREQEMPFWGTQAMIYDGWLKTRRGEIEDGIAILRQGLATYRATGALIWDPYHMALLADACGRHGNAEEELSLLTSALQSAEKTGEQWLASELMRRTGEVRVRRGEPALAEALFENAITVARGQSAKQWELRSARSISRLWYTQQKRSEAHDLLAPVYAWFTEGLDRPDLVEARALLEMHE